MAEESASEAAMKVQEVAANVRQAATRRRRSAGSEAEAIARRYFEAIGAHDLDAAVAMWAQGGRENVRGQVDVTAPEGVRTFIGDLFGALPDLHVEILSTTTEDDRCALQWRFTGTFAGPRSFNGIAPTGDHICATRFGLFSIDAALSSYSQLTDSA